MHSGVTPRVTNTPRAWHLLCGPGPSEWSQCCLRGHGDKGRGTRRQYLRRGSRTRGRGKGVWCSLSTYHVSADASKPAVAPWAEGHRPTWAVQSEAWSRTCLPRGSTRKRAAGSGPGLLSGLPSLDGRKKEREEEEAEKEERKKGTVKERRKGTLEPSSADPRASEDSEPARTRMVSGDHVPLASSPWSLGIQGWSSRPPCPGRRHRDHGTQVRKGRWAQKLTEGGVWLNPMPESALVG